MILDIVLNYVLIELDNLVRINWYKYFFIII